MATAHPLNAELRDRAGKGAARAVRRAGRVPGVIYGNKQEPVLISVNPVDLMKEIQKPGFFSHVYEVQVGSDSYKVVRHEVELRCSPDSIPESLIADLAGLEIGDSVHISNITLPENVELTITDRDFTIATIAAPTVYTEAEEGDEEEAEEGAEAAEGGDDAEDGGDDEEKSEE